MQMGLWRSPRRPGKALVEAVDAIERKCPGILGRVGRTDLVQAGRRRHDNSATFVEVPTRDTLRSGGPASQAECRGFASRLPLHSPTPRLGPHDNSAVRPIPACAAPSIPRLRLRPGAHALPRIRSARWLLHMERDDNCMLTVGRPSGMVSEGVTPGRRRRQKEEGPDVTSTWGACPFRSRAHRDDAACSDRACAGSRGAVAITTGQYGAAAY